MTSQPPQQLRLQPVLDAFSDDGHPDGAPQVDDGRDDREGI
jgi:hypothetical protein